MKKTVLVMGAGTSMPYGYPTGGQLIEMICDLTPYNGDWISIATKIGYSRNDIESFCHALKNSQQDTIDTFLNSRKDLMSLGKLAIAYSLASKENLDFLMAFENRRKGCYQFIFKQIFNNLNVIGRGELSIITFNYDRSLEHCLYLSFKNSLNSSDEEIKKIFNLVPIIHIHGSLGPLDWESELGRPYSNNLIPDHFLDISKNFDLLHDFVETESLNRIRQTLFSANQICFLGFGYHSTNMEKLGINQVNSGINVLNQKIDLLGTCLGVSEKSIKNIRDNWGIRFPDKNADSLTFLENHIEIFE